MNRTEADERPDEGRELHRAALAFEWANDDARGALGVFAFVLGALAALALALALAPPATRAGRFEAAGALGALAACACWFGARYRAACRACAGLAGRVRQRARALRGALESGHPPPREGA